VGTSICQSPQDRRPRAQFGDRAREPLGRLGHISRRGQELLVISVTVYRGSSDVLMQR